MKKILLLPLVILLLTLCNESVIDLNRSKTVMGKTAEGVNGQLQVINVKYSKPLSNQNKLSRENSQILTFTDKFPTNITYSLFLNDKQINNYKSKNIQSFPSKYTEIEGVLTFRGNNLRNSPSYGFVDLKNNKLNKLWSFTTSSSSWGGGAGWTGQPSIIKWSEDVKQIMNIKDEYKKKKDFVEVIYASLDGNVYFIDLDSGKETRKPIKINSPIKGSLSIDPRGYPILYVGQGIEEGVPFRYRVFSLINNTELFHINGNDKLAYRGWGAFDSSAIINKDTDTMLLGGENGIFYNIKLNTKFDLKNKSLTMNPEVLKYRYKIKTNGHQGIENSVASYKNLAYFADNGGSIQAIDLMSMKPLWVIRGIDDTDATLVLEVENDIPYIYTGSEVDKQGVNGYAYLRKINGLTGEIVWEKKYKCFYQGGKKPVNGGLLATPVLGKNDTSNMVFFTLARYNNFSSGIMLALDKKTGNEIWKWNMKHYGWSSPLDFYNSKGKTYLIQNDSVGNMHLIEGKTGKILHQINLGANIESSPAMYNDTLVVAIRGRSIFGVKVN